MKYERTDSFVADFKRLKPEHKAAFKRVVTERFAPACEAWAKAQDERKAHIWPKALRVEQMRGTSGITEMTWSYASPDGRATSQLVREADEWNCQWRRVGDHGVYDAP